VRRRAFSLIETVLACALLAVSVAVLFSTFELGSRSFRFGTTRQGLQNSAKRVLASLDTDIRRSDFSRIATLARAMMGGSSRDGVCLPGLSNPSAAGAFDVVTGLPRWDRYVVYYSTSEPEGGRLLRQVLQPPGAPYASPLRSFSEASNLNDVPANNAPNVLRTQQLTDGVEQFSVRPDGRLQVLRVELLLRARGGRRPGSQKQTDESLQLVWELQPENTQ
jgi:hypothetical protein